MKFCYCLILLFTLFNCSNQTQNSYKNLEKAFVDWYYKYSPTKATLRGHFNNNNLYRKYSLDSYNEKFEDINLFKIELSQIDETRLNENQFRRFVKINDILDYLGLLIQCQIDKSYDFLEPLFTSYKGLLSILKINDSDIEMERRVENLNNRIQGLVLQLKQIGGNLDCVNTSSSIAFDSIFKSLINLFDDIPISIFSDNETLDLVDKNIAEAKKELLFLRNIIKGNELGHCSYLEKRKKYLDSFVSKKHNEDVFNDKLDLKIIKLKNEIFDLSLVEYLKNNDEPVWVDYDDTLNVINSIVPNIFNNNINKDEYVSEIYSSINSIYEDPNLKYIKFQEQPLIEFGSFSLHSNSPIGFISYGLKTSSSNIYLDNNFDDLINQASYNFLSNSYYLHSYIFSNLVLLNTNNFYLDGIEVDYIYFDTFLLQGAEYYLKNYYFNHASIDGNMQLIGKILLKIESLINTYKLIAIYNSYDIDDTIDLFNSDDIISQHINIEGVLRELDLNYMGVIKEHFSLNEIDYNKKIKINYYFNDIKNVLISNGIKTQLAFD